MFEDDDDDNDSFSDDEGSFDADYVVCSICQLWVLRSSDLRAIAHGCCLDCYYDVILERD